MHLFRTNRQCSPNNNFKPSHLKRKIFGWDFSLKGDTIDRYRNNPQRR